MKKILFASTALVATASVAAADVTFSGYGRFGLGYVEDRNTDTFAGENEVSDTAIVSRFRLTIDADAETDGGVRFGARVRIQADEDADTGEAGEAGLNAARFFVENGGLRVEAGNVAGAIDNLPGYYGFEPGLEGTFNMYSGVNYDFIGYSSTGGTHNGVYARYAIGDFAVAAAYDSAPGAEAAGDSPTTTNGDRWDIHAAYTFGNVTAALAYGETDTDVSQEITVLTLQGDFGPLSVAAIVGDEEVNDDAGAFDTNVSDTFYGLSASYAVSSATSVNFAYGDGSGDNDERHIGLGAVHDLGGGVSLRGAIGTKREGNGDSQTVADFGAQFSF
ncbi:porin [Leisingera sp. XS_AS12]|uniref:porin n=1 Tax=Leisingera sp. XS_AS12 TaxID=3241294 RepID=UPI0035173A08